jgi:hypothetical protein
MGSLLNTLHFLRLQNYLVKWQAGVTPDEVQFEMLRENLRFSIFMQTKCVKTTAQPELGRAKSHRCQDDVGI